MERRAQWIEIARLMTERPGTFVQVQAWGVHLYTALGLVAAAMIAVMIVHGDDQSLHHAFAWMVVACFIDGTDGFLARRVGVKQLLPQFDGRKLDDIIDFHTYTSMPLLLIWRARILPPGTDAWLLLPLVASAYGFCQTAAKTDDGYFLGFPSYWNAVALYLFELHMNPWFGLAAVIVFAILTFVPIKYIYPSSGGPFSTFMVVGGVVYIILILTILLGLEWQRQALLWLSLCYPIAYLAASFLVTLSSPQRGSQMSGVRKQKPESTTPGF